jgi:hypothetical protein
LNQILAASNPGEPLIVNPEDWWCNQPLRYLASSRPWVYVAGGARNEASRHPPADPKGVFYVGFSGEAWARDFGLEGPGPRRSDIVRDWTVRDAAGRPLLFIWQMKPAKTARETQRGYGE